MKKILKNIFFIACSFLPSKLKNEASILMYHSIGDGKVFSTVTNKNFEWQLEYLHKNNYKVVFLSTLVEKINSEEDISNHIVLTFDDGYLNNYIEAFPLLKKYNMPVSIFIITGLVGKNYVNTNRVTQALMTQEQLTEMTESGLAELLPHTRTHPEIPDIKSSEYSSEIDGAHSDLTKTNTTTSKIFAYPRGKYNHKVIEYLKNNGWSAAVGVHPGLTRIGDNIFELRRNSIDTSTSKAIFKGKVTRVVEWYNNFHKYI